MSRQDEYDDYDDAPAQKVWGAASILVGVAALAGFLALAWYAYHSGNATQDPAQAELVTAETTPYKEVPKDPGGWQAPHRDKTIYEVIDNNAKPAPTAERLTASPEEPLDRRGDVTNTAESGTSTWMNAKLRGADVPLTDAERQKAGVEEKVEAVKAEVEQTGMGKTETPQADAPPPEAAKPPKSEAAKSETPKPDAKAIAAAINPAPLKHSEAKPATKPKPVIHGGNTRIQLGAFRSENDAADRVKRLSAKVPGILGGKSTIVERADLGEKGVYYRLFGLNFSREDAVSACARIQAARLDCMVK